MPKLSMISTSREYQSLCNMFSSNWKFLIETDIKKMCQHVQSFDEPKYHTDAGRKQIGYQDHDGIDFEKSYGYRTVFAYLSEYEKGNLTQSEVCQYLNMKVSCGQFSYANINPSLILGVTGTVEVLSSYEYSVMTKFNIKDYTTLPSSYGPSNLKFDKVGDGIKVFQEKDDYFREIAQEINDKSCKNDDTKSLYRAIIVFFENNNRLEEFQRSEYFRRHIVYKSSINILTEETDERTRDVYVSKAATCGQITLTTKYFGRGTDFVSWDEELNQKGGVHVLQTFLSTTESEEVQIKGRSARQGQNGSYGMILLESDDEMLVVTEANGDKVEKHKEDTLARFNISPGDINNMAFNNRYKFLNDKRIEARQEEGREIDESLEEAKERDTLSHIYFDCLLSGQSRSAREAFIKMQDSFRQNIASFHIVMLLDESGSMGKRGKFAELTSAYQSFVNLQIQNNAADDILSVIMFDDTARSLASLIPLEQYPALGYRGGRTNFAPALFHAQAAIRVGLNKCPDSVPVLILMTDGSNDDRAEALSAMKSIDNDFSSNNLQCNFVAFGSNANLENLEALQGQCTKGTVSRAQIGELTAVFEDIANTLVPEYNG